VDHRHSLIEGGDQRVRLRLRPSSEVLRLAMRCADRLLVACHRGRYDALREHCVEISARLGHSAGTTRRSRRSPPLQLGGSLLRSPDPAIMVVEVGGVALQDRVGLVDVLLPNGEAQAEREARALGVFLHRVERASDARDEQQEHPTEQDPEGPDDAERYGELAAEGPPGGTAS